VREYNRSLPILKEVDKKGAAGVNISATAEAVAVIFTITCAILEKWPHEDEGSTYKRKVELQKGPQSFFRATRSSVIFYIIFECH
jgi:hypothetical protein